MSLVDRATLLQHLRLDSRDIEVDGLELWNASSDATAATAEVQEAQMQFIQTGGVAAGTENLTFAACATITALIAGISGLTATWRTRSLVPGASLSSDLPSQAAASCLGFASRVPVQIIDGSWIDRLSASAENTILTYTGRTFESTAYTEEMHDGRGTDMMLFNEYPVDSTATILVEELIDTTWSEVDSTAYRLDYESGILWKTGASTAVLGSDSVIWAYGKRNLRLSYTAGYTTIPPGLVNLCLDVAAEMFFQAGRDPRLLLERLGASTLQFNAAAFPPGFRERLNHWTRLEHDD